jgi:polyhydroxyalkanoate synthesis regulator phasin
MFKEIRRSLLAGLGAVLLTKDKVEEVSRKLADDAKMSKEDAERLAEELVETGERQWEDLEKSVTQSVRKALDGLDLRGKSEIEDLKLRVENLEARLAVLEKGARKGVGEQVGS